MDEIFLVTYKEDFDGNVEEVKFPHKTSKGARKHLQEILEATMSKLGITKDDKHFDVLEDDNVYYDDRHNGDVFEIYIERFELND